MCVCTSTIGKIIAPITTALPSQRPIIARYLRESAAAVKVFGYAESADVHTYLSDVARPKLLDEYKFWLRIGLDYECKISHA